MAAQPDAAGDQITGGSPLASGFGHPSTMRLAAPPDATLRGRTNTQRSSTSASSLSLKSSASSVRRAIFSLLTAMSTTMQSPGSASARSLVRVGACRRRRRARDEQRSAAATTTTPTGRDLPTSARFPPRSRLARFPPRCASSLDVLPQLPQGEHRARRRQRLGRLAGRRPSRSASSAAAASCARRPARPPPLAPPAPPAATWTAQGSWASNPRRVHPGGDLGVAVAATLTALGRVEHRGDGRAARTDGHRHRLDQAAAPRQEHGSADQSTLLNCGVAEVAGHGVGERRRAPAPTARRRRRRLDVARPPSPPRSLHGSPAASPTQRHERLPPQAQSACEHRRVTGVASATAQLGSAARTSPASRRTSTIAGNGSNGEPERPTGSPAARRSSVTPASSTVIVQVGAVVAERRRRRPPARSGTRAPLGRLGGGRRRPSSSSSPRSRCAGRASAPTISADGDHDGRQPLGGSSRRFLHRQAQAFELDARGRRRRGRSRRCRSRRC